MKSLQKIVVKVGTSTLTQGTSRLSRRYMLELARQISILHEQGRQIALVTSGAIAAGREILGHPKVDRSLASKQMFASVGQVKLMQTWTELFSLFDIPVGQVLLTRDDISHRKRYLNARNTLLSLFHHQVIPIINENDTVATKEIKVGDNDNLAALVANLMSADLLILLTDQKGLYTADPRVDPQAELIPVVDYIDEKIFNLARGASSSLGTGGMTTKIEAAQVAAHSGTPTIIASSSHPNVLMDIVEGHQVGTRFLTHITPRESRKRWLLSERRQGMVYVDIGAASKITHAGASLLPSGVVRIVGPFDRGAIVEVIDLEGQSLAVGVINYNDQEIQKILGQHSKHIESILGYTYGPEIIHRNNMTRINVREDTHGE